MDILALIIAGFFVCFIFWVMTSSLGFRNGLLVAAVVLGVILGGYFLFFTVVFDLFQTLTSK
jgi:hypothetical protein